MNKLLTNIAIAVLAALCSAAVASCSSSRRTAVQGTQQAPAAPIATNWKAEATSIAASYGTWERLRMPVKVELRSPKSVSISGTATLIRNSSIHISLRYFGFEVGWMHLTSDSVTIADKYHKRYLSEAITPFLAGAPVTIANVQDLLLGRMFEMGASTSLTATQVSQGTTEADDGIYYFIPRESASSPFTCGFALIPSASELSPLMLTGAVIGGENHPVEVRYAAATATKAGPMTTAASLSYTTGKTAIDATLHWNFDKSRWGADVDLPSVSVAGYSRVTLDMIMSMLGNL